MSLEKKLFNLVAESREEARKKVVLEFLNEKFGTGKDDKTSRYEYEVETFEDYKIILKRPAPLNKGFDFTVNLNFYLKGHSKKRHMAPSHDDVIRALQEVKNKISDEEYKKIKLTIKDIFLLNEFNVNQFSKYTFTDGDGLEKPISIILLAIRWLFIEQDITYWNWSGRSMLMNGLLAEGLTEV